MIDYSPVDMPSVLEFVFFPHNYKTPCPENAFDLLVAMEEGVAISCRFHEAVPDAPWILFFHGNGEVVGDYDDIAPHYNERGLNLVVADYRGYGASSGRPSLNNMVKDARTIFEGVAGALKERSPGSGIWVMGRSLGSTSALELACHYQDRIKGLIIESGFLNILRILVHLEIPMPDLPLSDIDQACLKQVAGICLPTLLIHGDRDTIVPLKEAELLYENLGSADKNLVVIPGGTHNDIFFRGMNEYLSVLEEFVKKTG